MAIELADPDCGAGCCGVPIDPRQRDRAVERRRARARGHAADLRPPDMDAVAMTDRIIGGDVEPHQPVPRMVAPLDQRLAPDEILRLALERHGEADAGL